MKKIIAWARMIVRFVRLEGGGRYILCCENCLKKIVEEQEFIWGEIVNVNWHCGEQTKTLTTRADEKVRVNNGRFNV